jgi:hypothetical protein
LLGCDQGEGAPVLDDAARDAAVETSSVIIDDTGSCTAGLTDCGGRCTDLRTDPTNCGGCNVVCFSTDRCNGGLCVPASSLQ